MAAKAEEEVKDLTATLPRGLDTLKQAPPPSKLQQGTAEPGAHWDGPQVWKGRVQAENRWLPKRPRPLPTPELAEARVPGC